MIIRQIPPPDKIGEAEQFHKPINAKEQYSEGFVESIGSVIPAGYEGIKIGMRVKYYHQLAIDVEYERGVKHHMVRFTDIWGESYELTRITGAVQSTAVADTQG